MAERQLHIWRVVRWKRHVIKNEVEECGKVLLGVRLENLVRLENGLIRYIRLQGLKFGLGSVCGSALSRDLNFEFVGLSSVGLDVCVRYGCGEVVDTCVRVNGG